MLCFLQTLKSKNKKTVRHNGILRRAYFLSEEHLKYYSSFLHASSKWLLLSSHEMCRSHNKTCSTTYGLRSVCLAYPSICDSCPGFVSMRRYSLSLSLSLLVSLFLYPSLSFFPYLYLCIYLSH